MKTFDIIWSPEGRVIRTVETVDHARAKRMTPDERRRALARNTRLVNEVLWTLGHNIYHDSIPLDHINETLDAYGFDRLEAMLLCGRDGRICESVGHSKWLSLSWHKMESGRYEVTAYVS